MSIKLDWEVSEAPHDDDARPSRTAAAQPPASDPRVIDHPPAARPPARAANGQRRRWRWMAALAVLAAAAGGGLWYYTQTGWQRVHADVLAAVRYEDQRATQGDTELLINVQDHGNVDWLAVRRDEAAAHQPAPRPLPILTVGQAPAVLTSLTVLDTEFVEASVSRQFTTPDGQSLTFQLPQFYRHGMAGDWLRSAPPGSFWGSWLDWHGDKLDIRYSERDADFVAHVAQVLDARLADACAAWAGGCPNGPPVRLYLSGFVGSLEYDPLSNVEVRIQTNAAGGNAPSAADYFLSVPSPQIAGIPADDAGRAYLTDYLAVRLIASLARHVSTSPQGYEARTVAAIQALGLARVDPGYLARGQQRDNGRGAVSISTERNSARAHNLDVQAWHAVIYTTVAGDTLTRIAAQFNTPVETIAQANHLTNPYQLAIGVRLVIPAIAPPGAP